MFKVFLYITLFCLFVSCVFSESENLRGVLKDVHNETLIVKDSEALIGIPKKENVSSNEDSLVSINSTNVAEIPAENRVLVGVSGADEEDPKCEESFTVWFNVGIPITTMKCEKYSIIYSGKKSGSSSVTEARYIQGEVSTVVITSDTDIKVNNKKLSTLSTDKSSPTDTSSRLIFSADERVLGGSATTAADEKVKVYSFPVGDKTFEVYLPNNEESSSRKEYGLGIDDKVFYTSSEADSKYTLKENGDLTDSSDNVILKGDSSSSAFKTIYVIPSLVMVLMSVLLL